MHDMLTHALVPVFDVKQVSTVPGACPPGARERLFGRRTHDMPTQASVVILARSGRPAYLQHVHQLLARAPGQRHAAHAAAAWAAVRAGQRCAPRHLPHNVAPRGHQEDKTFNPSWVNYAPTRPPSRTTTRTSQCAHPDLLQPQGALHTENWMPM